MESYENLRKQREEIEARWKARINAKKPATSGEIILGILIILLALRGVVGYVHDMARIGG